MDTFKEKFGLALLGFMLSLCCASCGDSDGGGGFVGATYNLVPLPIDNNTLTTGSQQVFAMQIFAPSDITIDSLVVDVLANPGVDISGVEVRDQSTATLPNSVIRFGFIPTYPLQLQIPINQAIPAGVTRIYVIYVDVVSFQAGDNIQLVLLDIIGTDGFGNPLLPLAAPIQGPIKSAGVP